MSRTGDNAGSDPNGINSYGSYGTGRGGFHLGSPAKVCKTAEELRFGSWVYVSRVRRLATTAS